MQKSILILTVVAVVIFSYFGFEQFKSSQKAQYSEQFLKSVEQLASKNLEVLLVGLASLEDLSRANKEQYRRVWKHLGNFLRHHKPLQPKAKKPYPEVEAIAKMLRERNTDYEDEKFKLDLSEANLEGAMLWGANLEKTNLRKANLRGADLQEANLVGANLRGADLEGASLVGANLGEADLVGANLGRANLGEVNLVEANLSRAILRRADLRRANLIGADLGRADLMGANLWGANLEEAKLRGANLVGALLGGRMEANKTQYLTNLTPKQLRGAYYDINYHIPKLPDRISEKDKPKAISYKEWRAKYRGKQ